MVRGKVVRFDEVRGYGFVAPEAGGEDVFVHVNDLGFDKTLLAIGASVEFEVEEGDRGLKAVGVRILEPAGDGVAGDVLAAGQYTGEVTEALLAADPTLTAHQILRIREVLVEVARAHGWVRAQGAGRGAVRPLG